MMGDMSGVGSPGRLLEIACDESGFEGENLVNGNTDVFAHASVSIDIDTAADCVREVRQRIGSPATEYKANHLLREKHRTVLTWLLDPTGPIHGRAHVHLTDKTFFVLGRVIDLLTDEVTFAAGTSLRPRPFARALATALYRDGAQVYGAPLWRDFLDSSNLLTRTKKRWDPTPPVETFFRTIDALHTAQAPGEVGQVVALLRKARDRADSFRARMVDAPRLVPSLDPLIPAITQAVVYWSGDGARISVVHDEQSALTDDRIAGIRELFDPPNGKEIPSTQGTLAYFRQVDSQQDPRIQLADFLAGVARKISSDELNGRGDPELTELLRPYVDAYSIWADDRRWL